MLDEKLPEPTEIERAVARAIGREMNLDYDALLALLKDEPDQIVARGQVAALEKLARAAIAEHLRLLTETPEPNT